MITYKTILKDAEENELLPKTISEIVYLQDGVTTLNDILAMSVLTTDQNVTNEDISLKTLVDINNNKVLPRTRSTAVIMNNNQTLEETIYSIENDLNNKTSFLDVQTEIASLVDSAPSTLNTLNELAAALGDDPNYVTTITTALSSKEPTITSGTTFQYYRGDKTWQPLSLLVGENSNFLLNNGSYNDPPGYKAVALSYSPLSNNHGATGNYSFTSNHSTRASGLFAAAINYNNTASGTSSFAAGDSNTASGSYSFVVGSNNTASGSSSFATGSLNTASGYNSHAEGTLSTASGHYSFAAGSGYANAQGYSQFVIGQHNIASGNSTSRVNSDYVFIIGNGAGYVNKVWNYSNALTVDWDGNLVASGKVTANGLFSSAQNHFMVSNNEFNFTDAYTSANDVYLNYKSGGGSNNFVNAYRFMNGAGGYTSCNASAFNPTSDYRIKSDIKEVEEILPKLKNLKPVNYEKLGVTGREYGLIAHEVEPYFPDLVRGEGKDAVDSDGDMVLQTVDYMGLSAILIKAIQEQQFQIDELKLRLEKLEN